MKPSGIGHSRGASNSTKILYHSVWMSILEAYVLNWLQFQFSQEDVMDMNTNSDVWVFVELVHGILLRFQYRILFGCQNMELHSNNSMCIKPKFVQCVNTIG